MIKFEVNKSFAFLPVILFASWRLVFSFLFFSIVVDFEKVTDVCIETPYILISWKDCLQLRLGLMQFRLSHKWGPNIDLTWRFPNDLKCCGFYD